MTVLMEFSVFPTDRGESLSPYVAACVEIVEASSLPYKLGPMGTTLEGQTVGELLSVVEKCLTALQDSSRRVEASIKLDWHRPGVADRCQGP